MVLRWSQKQANGGGAEGSSSSSKAVLVPPFRFSVVEGTNRQEALYRSAFPTLKNLPFLKRLKLKTIISLIPKSFTGAGGEDAHIREFCAQNQIQHEIFPVSGNQEPLAKDENDPNAPAPTHAFCAEVLTLCIDPDRLPLLIHCTNGAHVTGLIIALLRRLQNYSTDFYVEEFIRFTKHHSMEEEERNFIARFFQEITLPKRLPAWLWAGERLSRHPTLPLFGAAVSVGISNEDWQQDSMSTASELLQQEEELLLHAGMMIGTSGNLNGMPMMSGSVSASNNGGVGGTGVNMESFKPAVDAIPTSSSSLANSVTIGSSGGGGGGVTSTGSGGGGSSSNSSSANTSLLAEKKTVLSAAVKSMVNEDEEEEDGPRGLALEGPTSLFRRRSVGL